MFYLETLLAIYGIFWLSFFIAFMVMTYRNNPSRLEDKWISSIATMFLAGCFWWLFVIGLFWACAELIKNEVIDIINK